MRKEKERSYNELERTADKLISIGVGIALCGIGVITSGGAVGNPRLMASGAAAFSVGLYFYSAGRLIHALSHR